MLLEESVARAKAAVLKTANKQVALSEAMGIGDAGVKAGQDDAAFVLRNLGLQRF
jgi:hypothetical protein